MKFKIKNLDKTVKNVSQNLTVKKKAGGKILVNHERGEVERKNVSNLVDGIL